MSRLEDNQCSACGEIVSVPVGMDFERGDRCWACEIATLRAEVDAARELLDAAGLSTATSLPPGRLMLAQYQYEVARKLTDDRGDTGEGER